MITGIDHVQLAMPPGGEARARAFYAGLLGFDEAPKPEPHASRGGCWFEKGSVYVHLGVEQDFAPARKAHPAFKVDDLEVLARILEGNGAVVDWGEAMPGHLRFHAHDPFGNRIEFMLDGEGFSDKP